MVLIVFVSPYHFSSLFKLRTVNTNPLNRVILISVTQVLATIALVLCESSLSSISAREVINEKPMADTGHKQADFTSSKQTNERALMSNQDDFSQPQFSPTFPKGAASGTSRVAIATTPEFQMAKRDTKSHELSSVPHAWRAPTTIDYVARNSQATKEALLLFELYDGEITPVGPYNCASRHVVEELNVGAEPGTTCPADNGKAMHLSTTMRNRADLQGKSGRGMEERSKRLCPALRIEHGSPESAMQWTDIDFDKLHPPDSSRRSQPLSPHYNFYSMERPRRHASPR